MNHCLSAKFACSVLLTGMFCSMSLPPALAKGSVDVPQTINNITVSGNRFYRDSAITESLGADDGYMPTVEELEANIKRSNKENDFRVEPTYSVDESTGNTNVELSTEERLPWQIEPTFDNNGRPSTGLFRSGVEFTNESLFGFGDKLSTEYRHSRGTDSISNTYSVPVNDYQDRLKFRYSYRHTESEARIESDPDVIGTSKRLGVFYSHPFDEAETWVGEVGFEGSQVKTERDDVRRSFDEVRALSAGIKFNRKDSLGRTKARLKTTHAFEILGGNESFWSLEGGLSRLFFLPLDNNLLVSVDGQYSPDALPSAEAFRIGGADSVRGYTRGLIRGDRGYNLTVEDRFHIPFLARMSPGLDDRLRGAVFYDLGQAWLDKSNSSYRAGTSSRADRTLLSSAGFGLRAKLCRQFEGYVDFGFGLVDRNNLERNAQPTARIHFGISSNLIGDTFKRRGDVAASKPNTLASNELK